MTRKKHKKIWRENFDSKIYSFRPSQEVLIQNKILQNEVHSEVPIPLRGDVVERLIQFIEQKGKKTREKKRGKLFSCSKNRKQE